MKNYLLLCTTITLLLSLPLISAQYGLGYIDSPADLLENEWLVFTLFFIFFFAVSFFAVKKSFGDRGLGAAMAVSLVIAFFIASAFSNKAYLGGYFGEQLKSLITIAAILIAIVLLGKVLVDYIGWGWTLLLLFVTLIFMSYNNYYPFFFEVFDFETQIFLENIYFFLTGVWGLFIIGIITLISLIGKFGKYNKSNTDLEEGFRKLFSGFGKIGGKR